MTLKFSILNFTTIVLFLFGTSSYQLAAQNTLNGQFTAHPQAEMRLKVFNGPKDTIYSQTVLGENGHFQLNYPNGYKGIGIIEIKDQGNLLLVLGEPEMSVSGTHIKDFAHLEINASNENKILDSYMQWQGQGSARLIGWNYLYPLYEDSSTEEAKVRQLIKEQVALIHQKDSLYRAAIPEDSYVKHYINYRKVLEAQQQLREMPGELDGYLAQFKTFNHTHPSFWTSGLMQDVYFGHYMLIYQYYQETAELEERINRCTLDLLNTWQESNDKKLVVSKSLLGFFEQYGWDAAASFLSDMVLNNQQCSMSDGLERRFQQYTRMKIENKAPEMEFDKGGLYMFNGKEQEAPHNLKENSAPYKLVVFWESTCSHCLELLPQLKNNYVELQKAGVEVFGINMDENKEEMRKVSEAYPWGNYCDGKGLLGEIAQKYYVSATPSMYLIDSSGSLALRPVKIEEIMRFLQERSKL